VVFSGGYQNADVFVVSAEGGTPVQLTNSSADDAFAHWSPDGLRIALLSRRTGRLEAWLFSRERLGGPWHEAVQLTDFGCYSTNWGPDGSSVLCAVHHGFVLVSVAGAALWRRAAAAAGFSEAGFSWFAEGGASLYLTATRGGREGIRTWPLAGGEPRLLVAFDDPRFVPGAVSTRGDRVHLTVAQNEGDIWVMNLRR
jgi:TolB protein